MSSDKISVITLNVENGTVLRILCTWEYDVKVAPGTTELILNPTTSDSNAFRDFH